MRIAKRLKIAFYLGITVALLVVASCIFQISRLHQLAKALVTEQERSYISILSVTIGYHAAQVADELVISRDFDRAEADWATDVKDVGEAQIALLDEIAKDARQHEMVSAIKNQFARLIAMYEGELLPALKRSPDLDAAMRAQVFRFDDEAKRLSDMAMRLKNVINNQTDDLTVDVDRIYHAGMIAIFALSLLAVGLTFLFSRRIIRSVVEPLAKLTKVAEGLAAQNVHSAGPGGATDEIGQLTDSFYRIKVENQMREMEAMLVQSEKLAAIGEIAASITHDIKQPLNSIKIINQGILRNIEKGRLNTEELTANAKEVVTQINRMARIIDHMLTFTRKADSSRMERVDIHTVINSVYDFLSAQFHTADVLLEKNLAGAGGVVMHTAIALEQVFMNILMNAKHALLDAGKETKKVTITTRLWDAATSPLQKDSLAIEFADNGPGMPPEVAERIFEPFFTTKEAGKGTGLGLSIAKRIVGEGGGTIILNNKPGEGVAFIIVLPLAEAAAIKLAS